MEEDWIGCDFCGADETLMDCGDYWLCSHCLEVMHAENLYAINELVLNEREPDAPGDSSPAAGGEEE